MQGRADWGVAIRSVATLYGLAFLPIAPEQYDFLLREDRLNRPAMQAFLAALRSEELRRRIQATHMEPEGGTGRA
jgi:putative molybdopterin biosynthesis protein